MSRNMMQQHCASSPRPGWRPDKRFVDYDYATPTPLREAAIDGKAVAPPTSEEARHALTALAKMASEAALKPR